MNRRPPGGECHDIFEIGNDLSGSSAPANPHHRISKPPGGDTSDIFTTPSSTPPSTPRKVKNYMASNIFTPADESRNVRQQRPDDNSFTKLFGAAQITDDTPDGGSPRGKNYQKSNVLFPQTNGTNGHLNGNGKASSLSGDSENGSISGTSSGSATPSSSGSICGDLDIPKTNGTTNGVAKTNGTASNGVASPPNGAVNGTNGSIKQQPSTPSRRIPPGGFSTKLW
jgi:hypothetical protein